jgi:hypothetical protein
MNNFTTSCHCDPGLDPGEATSELGRNKSEVAFPIVRGPLHSSQKHHVIASEREAISVGMM